jgi:hypothetical protein
MIERMTQFSIFPPSFWMHFQSLSLERDSMARRYLQIFHINDLFTDDMTGKHMNHSKIRIGKDLIRIPENQG